MAPLPYIFKMVLIPLYLFAFFMKVGSQPIFPQKIASHLMPRHPDTKNPSPDSQGHSLSDRAVLPMEPDSLRRRSNYEGMVASTSDVQGQVSSLSSHTGSDVAGPEQSITTPSNSLPGISRRAALYPKAVATSGWNSRGSPQVGGSLATSDSVRQNIGSGQAVGPHDKPTRTISVCMWDPSYSCW
ncbi:hypothetical protein PGTUg99_029116 [Puccinia graminis f. sp. tritici]|uniref:Uncharacterized protein n=1 Tax=Puccinia graminis f. sp. tritici TaxID=56615 RepID=A0A5B0LT99_PUCGR|nr:hypothetical protein PGTUg99_029116 [Puccinia graminis f. sp. tritici]